MTLHDALTDALTDTNKWTHETRKEVAAVLDVLRAHRAEVIEHLGLRDLMVSVDSTCSHVAFRKMLSKNDIDALTDVSRRARECYQDKPR